MLDVAYVSVGYTMKFTDNFGFNTAVAARFNGTAHDYQYDNPIEKMVLRYDLNLTANFDGLGLWAGMRLDVWNLAANKEKYGTEVGGDSGDGKARSMEVDANIKLRASISYNFNMSGN